MRFTLKQTCSFLLLVMLCALLTGCPADDYTVEMQPVAGGGVERTLTFYRADGNDSKENPNYQDFPSNELAAITSLYPEGSTKVDGKRYTASGIFSGALPADVGGSGSYTNFVTSLGESGVYLERFRGNDDLAGQNAKRSHAADQLTDLAIGWTKAELGREPGYPKLRKFLDKDFRQDLKNAGIYAWMGENDNLSNTNNISEFTFRFCQYLYEHGYLKLSDTRDVYSLLVQNQEDDTACLHLVRRLLMEKMDIPPSEPLPKSFAVFDSTDALMKSWTNYLTGTDLYRERIKAWEEEKKSDTNQARPEPEDVFFNLAACLVFGQDLSFADSETDHLTVKLKLAQPPAYTNGKWQDGQVVWSSDLEDNRPLPAFCCAIWMNPNAQFQTEHFGGVILDGDDLSQYCLWQGTLNPEQAGEWETFLETLKLSPSLTNTLAAFQFSGAATQTNAYLGRKLLIDALHQEAAQTSAVSTNTPSAQAP